MRQSGDLVGHTVPREQGLALLVLEGHQGLPAGGAVDAQPRHLQAPALGLIPDIGQVFELASLEEPLPGVGDAPLDLGLVFGVARSGRVGDEAPALGVFQEAPGENGMQRVRRGHRGRAIVDDQVPGDAAEEGPGRLQPGDDVLQLLVEGGPDEAMPGVAQHHDQRPHRTASTRFRVMDQAQAAEIHLRHFPRWRLFHAHCGAGRSSPLASLNETPHRLVAHRTAPRQQQLVNARHLQPVAGEPLVYLVGPRGQQLLAGRRRLPRPRLAHGRQPTQLVVGGSGAVPGNALCLGSAQVLPYRVPRYTGPRCNSPVSFTRLPAPNDFLYLHSGYLPVRHRCTSLQKCPNGRRLAPRVGQ